MIKPGDRLLSSMSTTEVVVVRASNPAAVIECGGVAMVPAGTIRGDLPADDAAAPVRSLLGKRYGSPDSPVELLCVKAGAGALSADGNPLPLRQPKPLPASD